MIAAAAIGPYGESIIDPSRNRPASFLRFREGPAPEIDPSSSIPGMPPGMGQHMFPHVATFQGVVSSVSKVYRPSDEALKHSRDNARFMMNDPIVRECIDTRRRCVALLNGHLEPDNPKDQKQIELCERLTKDLESIKRFTQYREWLQMAIWTGRSACEHKWGWRFIDGKRRAVPQWLPIHGDKLVFRYDDGSQEYDPNQVGIRVGAGFQMFAKTHEWRNRPDKVQPTDYGLAYFLDPWERSQIAIHKHLIEDGEYEDPQSAGRIHGLGIRSIIYWVWYQKQEALAWMMEYLERSAFGIEIWYYPWGNEKARQKTLEAARDRIGDGRNIVLVPKPMGEEGMSYGVERIEPGMAGVEALKEIITDYFGHQIKRYILGQTMTTEAHATGIGSSLPEIHLDTFMQIVKYDATNHEETITDELVERLKAFNEPWARDIPVRYKVDTESEDAEGKLKAFREAYDMGLALKGQDVRDIIGAAKPDADDEVLQMPQQQPGMGDPFGGALGQQPRVLGMPAAPEAVPAAPGEDTEGDVRKVAGALGVGNNENSERERLATFAAGDQARDDDGKFSSGGSQANLFGTDQQKGMFDAETQEEKNRRQKPQSSAKPAPAPETKADINARLLAEWKEKEAKRLDANKRAAASVPAGLRNFKNTGPTKQTKHDSLVGQRMMFSRSEVPLSPLAAAFATQFSARGFVVASSQN